MEPDLLNLSGSELTIFWLILFVVLIIIELLTVGLTTIWFALGSLAAAAVNLLHADFLIQVIVFLAVSCILLFFTRPWAQKHLNSKRTKTNYESLIGRTVKVSEKVDNLEQTGKASVNGQEWTVRSADDSITFRPGESARIIRITGVKLIIEKCREETI